MTLLVGNPSMKNTVFGNNFLKARLKIILVDSLILVLCVGIFGVLYLIYRKW